jgi:ubiquinone/menaquinone biosynthesis C-methylase UbiE
MNNDNFSKRSYIQHNEHYSEYKKGGKKELHASKWYNQDTVDYWRHKRLYKSLNPVLILDKGAKWLTVGDGRYGTDAQYILQNNGDVVASDISDTLLKEAKERNFISKYKKENAEAMTFNDLEFDYVVCKESYHHFPRPMIALYEMLRVAKKGVILIEPLDEYIREDKILNILSRKLKDTIDSIFNKKNERHQFETVGNYIFSISRREIEKVAVGLNYNIVAFKGLNDAFIPGVENEMILDKGPLFKRINFRIKLLNFLCKLGIKDYGLLATIIFKKDPSPELINELMNQGYTLVHLPENPYINV